MPLNNFGFVDEGLYRGAQPDEDGFATLDRLGMRYIVKLNSENAGEEAAACEKFSMDSIYRPMDTLVNLPENIRNLTDELAALVKQGPTFIHCEHGRDRTGLIVAAFRIVKDHWTLDEAQAERKTYGVDGIVKLFDFDMDLILKELAGAK